MPKLKRSEWLLIAIVSAFFMALIGFMIWFGYARTPEGSVFLNFQTINTGDTPVYYSWIEQVVDGHVLAWNLYTPEAHPRFLLDVFWLVVGGAAKLFSLSGIAAYNLARFITIPILAIVLYYFVAYFFEGEKRRRWVYLFTIFASGFGGILLFGSELGLLAQLKFITMDLWVPEGFTFLIFYHSPHFMMSYTLYLLALLLFLIGFDKHSWKYTILAGLVCMALFEFHPYHVASIFAPLVIYGIVLIIRHNRIPWDYLWRGIVVGVLSLPPIVYHYWTLQTFYIRQQHSLQNETLTTDPMLTLISYGALGITALMGFLYIAVKSNRTGKEVFLATWLVVHAALIYMPFAYQRRLTEGLAVVMALVAATGLIYAKQYLTEKGYWRKWYFHPAVLIAGFVLLFTLSNVYMIVRDVRYLNSGENGPYIPEQTMEAYKWIRTNTPEQSVIFGSYGTGNQQPAFGVRQSYIAHWGMTADYQDKKKFAQTIFKQTIPNEVKRTLLEKEGVDYLFFGPEEKAAFVKNPETLGYPVVFKNDTVTILQVTDLGSQDTEEQTE